MERATFRLAIAKESSLSSKFIKLIDKLLNLEEEYHNQCQTVDEIKQRRLKESKAILDEYFTLASSSLNSSDGALRKAINYSLEQKEKLSRFLEDGHIPLSNNLAERGIKPFVICRKNFLFSNTIQGAKASAIIFSIIQTARANGINIFNYLQRLFIKLPETPISQLD
ncbi:MAG: transposase [Erysipelotrichaceae bacterium]|nr:transposase [Erysipelotrichaceae bacterium]